ncbi:MAG: hypothetical protein JO249_25955 [Acidobacteria bacterium]|nr:hypothetical protein [Acidobacteriota bacterium]
MSSDILLSTALPGTASGENPAPGTGAPSAFNGTTQTISFLIAHLFARELEVEICDLKHRLAAIGSIVWPHRGSDCFKFELEETLG